MRKHRGEGHHGMHHFGRHGHGHGRGERGEGVIGRLLGHGDLRYVILSLLEERPRHGYELIKALEELSHGAYSPSPGAIYPTLTFLEEGGFATSAMDESKKLYSITAEGRTLLSENKDFLTQLMERFSRGGERMSRLKQWMGRDHAENIARGDKSGIRKAMHGLKAELFSFMDANKETKDKIAAVIDRAAEEIRKLKE